jgi:hypothetical protein
MSVPERRAMVERPGENLSVRRQCALLNLSRSGVYRPEPVTDADDLAMMRRIDELHLKWPFFVSLCVSLYRYNIRLAAFYIARADVLRLAGKRMTMSDFGSMTVAMSPTVEFGRAPQPPIAQLVELLKAGKEAAK